MKISIQTQVLTLLALLCLAACKQDNMDISKVPEVKKPSVTKRQVPVKFESADITLNLKYKANTAILLEIDEGSGNKFLIDYTPENFPATLEKYQNGVLVYIVYYILDTKKKVGKAVTFNHDDELQEYTPTGSYTLSYKEPEFPEVVNYYNEMDKPGHTYIRTYNSSGILSEIGITSSQGLVNKVGFHFDQQNGISSLIPYSQLFSLEADYWFLFCLGGNLLSRINEKSPLENLSLHYSYADDGYPSVVNLARNGSTQKIKITYKTLE